MRTQLDKPVKYFLPVNDDMIYLNEHLGKDVSLEFTGKINCIRCGAATSKSFNQGYCYKCFKTAPENDESVFNPELSKSQFGISRDMEWAEEHDLIDHYVYLSITSGIKVGVTRHHQIPTRWIDQGAMYAISIAKTPNRHIAGIIESYLKQHIADKTNWRNMLKDNLKEDVDLIDEKKRIVSLLHPELQKYALKDSQITEIVYPGDYVPDNVASVTFDKEKTIEGKLMRIKGQYLIFQDDTVLNIRKHAGYHVMFKV
ncbi:MAG: DUF2797 domain-containing protein [Prolixibacteraceae bacterium]|nr:DUF2797 domain-containing protein [Prolixibacteraceae bacterium]